MSHASAEFKFIDGTVLYGEYNGTSDVMLPCMYETPELRSLKWRRQEWRDCTCETPPERCRVQADYGFGIRWDGLACRQCMTFIGPHQPHESEVDEG